LDLHAEKGASKLRDHLGHQSLKREVRNIWEFLPLFI